MSTTVRWRSLYPHAGTAWQMAYKDALRAVSIGQPVFREGEGTEEIDLLILSYEAIYHEKVRDQNLLSLALTSLALADGVQILILCCDYSEPEVSNKDVSGLLDQQSPRFLGASTIARALAVEAVAREVEQFLRVNVTESLPTVSSNYDDEGDWDH